MGNFTGLCPKPNLFYSFLLLSSQRHFSKGKKNVKDLSALSLSRALLHVPNTEINTTSVILKMWSQNNKITPFLSFQEKNPFLYFQSKANRRKNPMTGGAGAWTILCFLLPEWQWDSKRWVQEQSFSNANMTQQEHKPIWERTTEAGGQRASLTPAVMRTIRSAGYTAQHLDELLPELLAVPGACSTVHCFNLVCSFSIYISSYSKQYWAVTWTTWNHLCCSQAKNHRFKKNYYLWKYFSKVTQNYLITCSLLQ